VSALRTEFLAPPEEQCAVCGTALEWCVGGTRCPREHDEEHEGRCLVCGEWVHFGECEETW
jgi:hypothetical protein